MEGFATAFLKASLAWLALGVTLGVCMAAHPAWLVYRPAHVHMNLLGFVTMMIYGVAYHVIPRFTGHPLYSRRVEPPAVRQRLFGELGRRFRTVGWVAIAVLVVTGVLNVYFRGWLHWSGMLGSAAFWHTALGHALAAKLLAVVAMIAVSATHDFLLGPAAGRAAPGSRHAVALRRRAALLARANAFLGVLLVIAAVRLARGG